MRSATRRKVSSPAVRIPWSWAGGGDDGPLGVVLGRLDAIERALVIKAEPVGVQQDRLQLVEAVGLGGQTDPVALHGLDEGVDDLVVERAHPTALERGVEVVLEERVEVPQRLRAEVALAGPPFFDVVAEPHHAVFADALGLALALRPVPLCPVDLCEPLDRLLLGGEAGLLGLPAGRAAVADLVLVGAL